MKFKFYYSTNPPSNILCEHFFFCCGQIIFKQLNTDCKKTQNGFHSGSSVCAGLVVRIEMIVCVITQWYGFGDAFCGLIRCCVCVCVCVC